MPHSSAPEPAASEAPTSAPSGTAPPRAASPRAISPQATSGVRQHPDRLPFPAHRAIGLTDGVFAIVLTLLVLELRVPEPAAAAGHAAAHQQLLAMLGTLWSSLLWYVVTGLTVGSYWTTHSRLMALTHQPDGRFASRNVLFLLAVALLPFVTSTLSRYPVDGAALALYAGTQLSINLLLLFLMRGQDPQASSEGGDSLQALSINVVTAFVAFLLMLVLALWQPQYAYWSLLVLALRRSLLARLGVRAAQG